MKDWGLHDVFTDADATSRDTRAALARLAKRLKWERKYEPTLAQLAKQTNSDQYYSLIYQASSRTVHFSPAELLRRAWSTSKDFSDVTISSKYFNEYWSHFALGWTFDIFVHLIADLVEWVPDMASEVGDRYLELIKEIGSPRIPIITAAELNIEKDK